MAARESSADRLESLSVARWHGGSMGTTKKSDRGGSLEWASQASEAGKVTCARPVTAVDPLGSTEAALDWLGLSFSRGAP
jgi:hypothetical protein